MPQNILMRFAFSLAVLSIAALGAVSTAKANLVPLSGVELSGQGIGAKFTVLDLKNPGGSSRESGGVGFSNGDFHAFGDFGPPDGPPKNRAFTLADIGATNTSELAILLDLAEPGSEDPISVDATDQAGAAGQHDAAGGYRITLQVYDANGVIQQSHVLDMNRTLISDAQGVGGSGLVFVLDAAQAAALQAFINANPGYHLTIWATLINAEGGNDTFSVARIQAVPEPASMLLLGTGLLGIAGAARRRFRKQ